LNTTPQVLVRSVPFVYDGGGQPAVNLTKVKSSASGSSGVSLVKGYQAAQQALANFDLAGIRLEVLLLLDGSLSMKREYEAEIAQQLAVRTLGFCLNVDADEQIPVIMYGANISKPVVITLENYQQAPQLLRPNFGSTPMTEALQAGMAMAARSDKLTMIVNITDGNPDNHVSMSNEVIKSSGHPVFIKNLAIKKVPYLVEIDDLPSRNEIRMDDAGQPIKDADDMLVLEVNPNGLRYVDNVDSQAIDPFKATDDEFGQAIAEEISTYIEVAGRVGLLTGVPGVDRTVF